MKQFLQKNKKTLLNLLRIAVAVAILSVFALALLLLTGLVYIDSGIRINTALLARFTDAWYGPLLLIALQVLITTVLCFLPGTTMTFLVLLPMLYESLWKTFWIAFIATSLSSSSMYLVGRFGGRALCERFLGKEDCEKASALLRNRGTVYFPLMMLFPAFPDDALVMIAGTLRMSLAWFIPSILIGRGIGIASIIFGFGSIPYERFTTPLHWIVFICAVLIGVFLLFFSAHKLNRLLNKKRNENHKNA